MRMNAAGIAPSPAAGAAEDGLFSFSGSEGGATGESACGHAGADAASPFKPRGEHGRALPAYQLIFCRDAMRQRP